MKKIGIILLAVIGVAAFLWFGNRYTGKITDEVTLTTQVETYQEEVIEIKAIWRNKTSSNAMYGDAFAIEKLVEDSWERVHISDTPINFNAVGYRLCAFSSSEYTYELSAFTNGLQIGRYRIAAEFSVGRGHNTHQSTAYAYFMVE